MPSVSATTFDSNICSLSGYYKAKFKDFGPVDNDSQITITGAFEDLATGALHTSAGFDSMYDPRSTYSINAGPTVGTLASFATPADGADLYIGGLAGDLARAGGNINPLGVTGYRYCQCVAALVHDCDPVHRFADLSKLVVDADDTPSRAIGSTDTDTGIKGALDAEYAAIANALQAAAALDDLSNTLSTDREVKAIQSIADSLPAKLDNCAIVAVNTIA